MNFKSNKVNWGAERAFEMEIGNKNKTWGTCFWIMSIFSNYSR